MNIFNTREKSKSSLKMLPFVIDTNVTFFLYCSNTLLTKQTMCAHKVCLIHHYTRHFPTESNAHTNLNINFFAYCFNEQKVHTSFDVIS